MQDLFAAIQSKNSNENIKYESCLHVDRLKKKTIDQKRAMENDLKRTISKTVEEMNEKITNTKNQM